MAGIDASGKKRRAAALFAHASGILLAAALARPIASSDHAVPEISLGPRPGARPSRRRNRTLARPRAVL